jgi:Uma2 family endonuclease
VVAPSERKLAHRYLREPQPLFFPVDEEMPETRRHLEVRTALFQSLKPAFGDRAVIGSEQLVFWDPTDPRARCAPDVMVRVGERDAPFDSWKVWERGAPHLAVEIISASDSTDTPWSAKLERYRKVGLRELVACDADDPDRPLRIWDFADGDLVERDPATGALLEELDRIDEARTSLLLAMDRARNVHEARQIRVRLERLDARRARTGGMS